MNKLALAMLLLGCADRQHLYSKTGLAKQAAFAHQARDRDVAAPKPLDAEDAQIVLTNYRSASTRKTTAGISGAPIAGAQDPSEYGLAPEPSGPPPGGIQLQAK